MPLKSLSQNYVPIIYLKLLFTGRGRGPKVESKEGQKSRAEYKISCTNGELNNQ